MQRQLSLDGAKAQKVVSGCAELHLVTHQS
jgi:hypothetical protein